jgi:hypothetical protein
MDRQFISRYIILVLVFVLSAYTLSPIPIYAQLPAIPKPIALTGDRIYVSWVYEDSTRYRIDVAEDSVFTHFVPGLRDYGGSGMVFCGENNFASGNLPETGVSSENLFNPRPSNPFDIDTIFKRTYITLVEFPLNRTLYIRMRAINAFGSSPYSTTTTATISTGGGRPGQYNVVQVIRTQHSQAYIPSSQLDQKKQYRLQLMPVERPSGWCEYAGMFQNRADLFFGTQTIKTISSTDTVFTIPDPTQSYLLMLTEFPLPSRDNFNQPTFISYNTLSPMSEALNPFIERVERISPYQVLHFLAIWTSQERELFYIQLQNSFNRTPLLTPKNIDSLFVAMLRAGVPIDTVWFQESLTTPDVRRNCAFVTCSPLIQTGTIAPGYNLMVKLRRPDSRMNMFGQWIQNFPVWRYDSRGVPMRYTFRQTPTAVQQNRTTLSALRAEPNPFQSSATLTWTLPTPGTILVEVFDMLGRSFLHEEHTVYSAGAWLLPLTLGTAPSGVYRVRVRFTPPSGLPLTEAVSVVHLR